MTRSCRSGGRATTPRGGDLTPGPPGTLLIEMSALAPNRTPRLRDERWLAAGAALVTVAVWASAFVGIRSAGRSLDPGELALGRLCVGAVPLGAIVLARRERLPRGRALAATVFCGVLWFGLHHVALN